MGVVSCALNGLYNIICRDVDTAEGGIDPDDVINHAPSFLRHVGEPIDELPGDGIDRKVQILYDGTAEWHTLKSSSSRKRMRTFNAIIRIGYFAGSHVDETHIAMGDDEQDIAEAIGLSVNWPDSCTEGCVNGYIPATSSVKDLEDGRFILEITVQVQVTG